MQSSIENPGAALARTALFADAPDDVLALCVAGARRAELAPGDPLQPGDGLCLLLNGSLRVLLPDTAAQGPAMAVDEHEVLGVIQAVTGQATDTHAVCITPCSVLAFDRALLRELGQRFEAFDARLAQCAALRLHRLVFGRTLATLVGGMDGRQFEALVQRATELRLERDACLMQQGDVADAGYVLTSGRLSVVTEAAGSSLRGVDLLPGASVGEMVSSPVAGSAARGTRCAQPWTLLLGPAPDAELPRNTRAWLDSGRFDRHFHLRVGDAATMDRAARLLTGRATGLALSGGGARGFAHIGVLQAFTEAGPPIHCIGGTSMGAIQAAMFAMGMATPEMVALNRYVIGQRPFREYTLPFVALVASRRRDACAAKCFGDLRIEDLWLPCMAVSTDLHGARAVVHERGSLTLATAASSSVPGVLVPVLDGERVLVDGGIVNNLPADLVKARCGGTVFASKVAPSDDVLPPVGGFPSAWATALHRLLPWRAPLPTPTIGDLLVRTMTVGSAEHRQRVSSSIDVLIEPDVDRYGMLQFGAIGVLVECGLAAARQRLQAWVAGDVR